MSRGVLLGLAMIAALVPGFLTPASTPRPMERSPESAAGGSAADWLTPEAWNVEACGYPGGAGLFRGRIYNATPTTTGEDVNLWVTGLGGWPTTVSPDFLQQTPYGERFGVSVAVEVPSGAVPGVYTGTLYAEGTGTNRLERPLTLAVLTPGSQCTRGHLVLDGGDDYAEAADHAELDVGDEPGESLTVEAWVNFQTFSDAEIISKSAYRLYADLTYQPPYTLRCLRAQARWQGGWHELSVCHTQYGGGLWIPGWHHVAFVIDRTSGQASLYMDGERETGPSNLSALLEDSADPLTMGVDLNGVMEEVRVSDIARYTGPTYVVPMSPFACDGSTRGLWHFDELDGITTFHDACGADNLLIGHNGARTGGVPAQRAYLPFVAKQSG